MDRGREGEREGAGIEEGESDQGEEREERGSGEEEKEEDKQPMEERGQQ